MPPLTDRERATVLAALRYWRDEMAPHATAAAYPDYLPAGLDPLTADEIDALCERLTATTEGDP